MLGLDLVTRAKDSLYQICRGLKTVAMHTFREPITQVYPDKMPDTHIRGRLAPTVNPETGEHLCISCRQCERVCPDKCIEITAHKSPETNKLEFLVLAGCGSSDPDAVRANHHSCCTHVARLADNAARPVRRRFFRQECSANRPTTPPARLH